MSVVTAVITAEDLERMLFGEQRVELVRGEVITMAPAGAEHGEIAGFTFGALFNFVRPNSLGSLFAAETGFILARTRTRCARRMWRLSRAERAAQQRGRTGFFEGPPDLAVEVVSPHDTAEEVEAKVLDYLEAGTRMVLDCAPANAHGDGVPLAARGAGAAPRRYAGGRGCAAGVRRPGRGVVWRLKVEG
jgi:Uma2 family endonuclease